ncbi:MAG: hypothetical protein WCP34_12170, partial [Pseudomonadota bacterium]
KWLQIFLMSVAVLTREVYVVFPVIFLFYLIWHRRIRESFPYILPILVLVIWNVFIYLKFSSTAFSSGARDVVYHFGILSKLDDLLFSHVADWRIKLVETIPFSGVLFAIGLVIFNIRRSFSNPMATILLAYVSLALIANNVIYAEFYSYLRVLDFLFIASFLIFLVEGKMIYLLPPLCSTLIGVVMLIVLPFM